MWTILKSIGFSILVITLLHYLWEYVKNNYSIRKTKDLVKIQTEKYDTILSELLEGRGSPEPPIDMDDMENDLAMFLEQTLEQTMT
jgi:hypothetical protein